MARHDDPEEIESRPSSRELTAPPEGDPPASPWTLIAHNKIVLRAWDQLIRDTPSNVIHCYDWLRRHPMKSMPGRCYPLRGKQFAGCWAYEIGAGDRVYYRPDEAERRVLVYYAGRHPKRGIPLPPKSSE